MHATRHRLPNPEFQDTRWKLVERACQPDSGESELETLQQTCLSYWYPLYAWARHSTGHRDEAADLVRGLFERLRHKGFLAAMDRTNGRLRTFLLSCLKRHASEAGANPSPIRGKAASAVALDFDWAERRYHRHAVAGDSPDALYDRRWANTLLHYTLETLEQEMVAQGGAETFAVLKGFLEFRPDLESSREAIAARLGISEAELKSRVFRLRKRFHELLKAQVAMTIGEGENPKDELMALMASV